MKKTFRFLTLSLMLLGGTLSTFADVDRPDAGPANDAKVGATVSGGVVVYQVTGWDAKYKNAAGTEVGAYKVQITGLDYTGLTENPTQLTIETAFQEKYGEVLCNYYVDKIIDTDPDAKKAFYAKTSLESLTFTISDAQFSEDRFQFAIGDYAFFGCTSLATITLPKNVKAIGAYAFQNTAITTFQIPRDCAEIEPYAFYNSKSLNTVTVEDNNQALQQLTDHVFANSTVSELDLRQARKLKTIGSAIGKNGSPFLYNLSDVNNQLAKVWLPSTVTEIYTSFAFCTALTEINGLESTKIEAFKDLAFENCSSLPVLNFPVGKKATVLLTGTPFVGCKKLENLTFAAGFLGTIGDATHNLYGAAEADLAALKKITFNGDVYGEIAAGAFVGVTALGEVEFKGALSAKNGERSAVIGAAFTNVESLQKVTFSGDYSIKYQYSGVEAADAAAIAINDNAFTGTAIEELNFKKIQVVKGTATIAAAFSSDALTSVTFGEISLGMTNDQNGKKGAEVGTLTLKDNAFVSTALTTATFGAITAQNGASIFTIGDGTNPVFNSINGAGDGALTTVKIAEGATIKGGAAANTIAANAFKSNALTTVTLGNLDALTGGTFVIGEAAFSGAKANAKTVTIGNIAKATTIGDNAFDGDFLANVTFGNVNAALTIGNTETDNTTAPFGGDKAEKSITFGNIGTAANVTIKKYAFSGKLLKSVEFGQIGAAANAAAAGSLTIGANAFENTTTAVDEATIATETISFGQVNATTFSIGAQAFLAPSKGGEAYEVTFGDWISAPTIAGNAFGAAARYGTTAYELGNVKGDISATVAEAAFNGSQDNADDKNNTTTVTTGDLDYAFKAKAFNKVYSVETNKWNIAGNLNAFAGVVVASVGDIPTTKTIAGTTDDANKLTTLTFKGNVADAAAIGSFTSPEVRKIQFTAAAPEVAKFAFAANSFMAAADDAETDDENLIIVYNLEGNSEKANQIFNYEAFANAEDVNNVILYTDEWSKDNVFQHYIDNTHAIYRLALSASPVVPGQTIAANCITGANGKYAYGRLYVPAGKGMKYYVDAKVVGTKTNVNLFSASIDGANIYMKQVDVVEGKYWIDATEIDQVFIVRTAEAGEATGDAVEVTAVPATDEIIAENEIVAADWFDKALGQKNVLKYATSQVKNQNLQNNAEFKNRGIYVMANPATRNLAFALLNQYETSRDLNKGSIYVLSKKANVYDHAPELNVIWEDDAENSDATGIETVKAAESNDAIYNLQGVRVNNAQKGIYIMNGKKFVVK